MLELSLWLASGAVLAFVLGVAAFVGVSYALAHRHAPRSLGGAARDAARELTFTLMIQPLLPLFWIFGRRLRSPWRRAGSSPGRRPVVFVHGYAQNRVDFVYLARQLEHRGFGELFGFNYDWTQSLEAIASRLGRFVDEVSRETGAAQVDLVCHSMGGLVAMQLLHGEGRAKIARCVTIASPFGGVRFRGPILGRAAAALRGGFRFPDGSPDPGGVPWLSVFSRHDNVVHPAATSSLAHRGGRDLDAGTMGHLAILFDRRVADAVADFLEGDAPRARAELAVTASGATAPPLTPGDAGADGTAPLTPGDAGADGAALEGAAPASSGAPRAAGRGAGRASLVTLALLLSPTACGGPPDARFAGAVPEKIAAPAEVERYALTPAEVVVEADVSAGTSYTLRFSRSSGELVLAPSVPASSTLALEVELGTARASWQLVADVAMSEFLHTSAHPKAHFASRSLRELPAEGADAPNLQLFGDFTLHGTRRTIAVPARLDVDACFVRLRCAFTIQRSDFGTVDDGGYEAFVSDDVVVRMAIDVARRGAPPTCKAR